MLEEILHAWRTNNRINLRLIESVSDEGMQCTLSKRGGRSVVRQFTHLQYVRVFQLRKRAKSLAENIRTYATYDEPDRNELATALADSAQRVEQWITLASEGAKEVKTFKRGLVPTVAYLIAHESHHRGNIILTLKECGHPVEKAIRDGIWGDWSRG
jgi:uncharacterized damage-inducible protein DinB